MKKHIFTRILHAVLAVAVIHQLVVSTFMQAPLDGKAEDFAFELHETVGFVAFGIVILFWVWVIVRGVDTSIKSLFPWFTSVNRKQVFGDIREALHALVHGHKPALSIESSLASAVHGLGLLLVLAMALTGSGWLLLEGQNEQVANSIIEIHTTLSLLVWVYLIAHAAMAVLHDLYGQPVLRRIFPFGRTLDIDKGHEDRGT